MSILYVVSETGELKRVVRKVGIILKMVLKTEDTPTRLGREKSQVHTSSANPPGRQGPVGLKMDFASLLRG